MILMPNLYPLWRTEINFLCRLVLISGELPHKSAGDSEVSFFYPNLGVTCPQTLLSKRIQQFLPAGWILS